MIFQGPSSNKNVNLGLNVLTGGLSGSARSQVNVLQGKKDPYGFEALKNFDPTVVKKANTGKTDQLISSATETAAELMQRPVERFVPTQMKAQTAFVSPTQAAQVGNVASRDGFLDAINMSQGRFAQAGQIDPRMQEFLNASLNQNGNTNQALAMAQSAAMGTAPSQAQFLMQQSQDDAIRAQMGMAGSGGFNAANMRGAQQQGAMLQQQGINQSAQLRAQEMANARSLYGQLGLNADQAQSQAFANAAGLQLNASQFQDQAKQNAMNSFLSAQQNLFGMDSQMAAQNAGFTQQANMANAAAANNMAQFNSGNNLQAQQLNNQFGQGALNSFQAAQQGFAGLGVNMFGQALGGQQGLTALEQQRQNAIADARSKMFGGVLSGAATAGAAAMSDRNQKKNIKKNSATEDFLNALTDNEYEYVDATLQGTRAGKNYGPMAQDLEKTAMGRTAVFESANGKMVDSARGFLLALSGLANINTRLSALEVR